MALLLNRINDVKEPRMTHPNSLETFALPVRIYYTGKTHNQQHHFLTTAPRHTTNTRLQQHTFGYTRPVNQPSRYSWYSTCQATAQTAHHLLLVLRATTQSRKSHPTLRSVAAKLNVLIRHQHMPNANLDPLQLPVLFHL